MTMQPATLPIGTSAPPFDLVATDGRRYRLDDFGAELFVYVQACNHCPYVLANVDRLVALARAFEGRVDFAFVNSNDAKTYPDDAMEPMRAFASEHALPFPYLRDDQQSVARAYRTQRTPEVLVFDADRRLRYHGRIDDSPKDAGAVTDETLRSALDALLAGAAVAEAETFAMGCTVKWKPGNFPEAH
ncbi:MAG: thioredoxin family protein [Deinococcales bacterium]